MPNDQPKYAERERRSPKESRGLTELVRGGDPDIVRVTKAVQTAKLLRVFYGATGLDRYLPGGDYLEQRGSLIRQVASK